MKAAELLARLRHALQLQQERGLTTALALAHAWGIPATSNTALLDVKVPTARRSRAARSTVRSVHRRRRIRSTLVAQRRVRRYRATVSPFCDGAGLSS